MSAVRTLVMALAVLLVCGCRTTNQPVATPTRIPATSAPETRTVIPTGAPTTAAPVSAPSPTIEPSPSPEAIQGILPASCEPTPPDQEGPFYVPGAPERPGVGQGHVLRGVVRSSADCASIAGAQVEFWLAGPDGKYDDDHRATLFADMSGAYRFESNFPPPYSGRPPHIHLRVSADGYRTLVTQYYPLDGQTEATLDLVLIPE